MVPSLLRLVGFVATGALLAGSVQAAPAADAVATADAATAAIDSAASSGIVADTGSAAADTAAPPLVATTFGGQNYACKCYIGQPCWPAPAAWRQLNSSVDGKLIVNIPPAAPCHNTFNGPLGTVATYNAAECADINARWFVDEQWQ